MGGLASERCRKDGEEVELSDQDGFVVRLLDGYELA